MLGAVPSSRPSADNGTRAIDTNRADRLRNRQVEEVLDLHQAPHVPLLSIALIHPEAGHGLFNGTW